MSARSIRELDSLPDRIKLHRQADRRGILIVEGPSDERFIQRLVPGRWAMFPAGTRNVVISTVEDSVGLRVDRVAGLVDQDFDNVVKKARERGLPIFWYENADLEAFLFLGTALDKLLDELSSEHKLRAFGGVSIVREKAIAVALEVAALREASAARQWWLAFGDIDLSKKIDRDSLSLKRRSYCQALAEREDVGVHCDSLHQTIEKRLADTGAGGERITLFSGKDALAVIGVALKSRIGSCETAVTKTDHLARVLRLSAPLELIDWPPFPAIGSLIDAT